MLETIKHAPIYSPSVITQFKEIPQYPGYYAGTDGEIYSARSGSIRRLSKRIHKGYYRVNIRDNGCPVKDHVENVHKLILNAFVGERPAGQECRHLNGNAFDNRPSNLCWGTPKENMADQIRHGTAAYLRFDKEGSPCAKLQEENIKTIWDLYHQGRSQKEIASVFSVCPNTISKIICGKNWRKISESLGEVDSLKASAVGTAP